MSFSRKWWYLASSMGEFNLTNPLKRFSLSCAILIFSHMKAKNELSETCHFKNKAEGLRRPTILKFWCTFKKNIWKWFHSSVQIWEIQSFHETKSYFSCYCSYIAQVSCVREWQGGVPILPYILLDVKTTWVVIDSRLVFGSCSVLMWAGTPAAMT